MRPFSDVDLGLLLPDDPDLMDLGELAGRVEDICRRPVDIVSLRGLPERDPELAFRIADEGVPIFESRRYAFADFKKEAFLWYIDTAPLRRMMKQALYLRIRSGEVPGERPADVLSDERTDEVGGAQQLLRCSSGCLLPGDSDGSTMQPNAERRARCFHELMQRPEAPGGTALDLNRDKRGFVLNEKVDLRGAALFFADPGPGNGDRPGF